MRFLVTGGAGFIGSNLAEELFRRGASVRVLDNFSAGKRENLEFGSPGAVEVLQGDICDLDDCRRAVEGVDYVLHHAALASVPRSIEDPLLHHQINVTGTLNMLIAARDARIRRFIFASSCAVYGNLEGLHPNPSRKIETMKPSPLSPYASGKCAGEENCRLFLDLYGLETVALRYFNVFGPRQDPRSDYAAVIPRFIEAVLDGKRPVIYGDGLQTRDFVFIGDVVEANLLACTAPALAAGKSFNIASGGSLNLLELLEALGEITGKQIEPVFADPKPGEVRHSAADVTLAKHLLGYEPKVPFREGLKKTVEWYGKK